MLRTAGWAAVFFALAASAAADGYSMKDGRYAGGPVTVLSLTAQQTLTAKTKRVVVLTADQQEQIRQDTGKGPSVLSIHSLKVAGKDCTCFDFNIAIWFESTRIEVPHSFVLSDEEAERRTDEIESIE